MIKCKKDSNKGVTLITLVITIVVLIIITSIVMYITLNDNGLLRKANNSKTEYNVSTTKEQIKTAVITSRINDAYDSLIDTTILEKELIYTCEVTSITKCGENGDLPWIVKKNELTYKISETGEVKEKNGITILSGDIILLTGIDNYSKTLTAELLNNETGTIKWTTTGNITLSNETGTTTTVKLSNSAVAGDTAKITAQIEGTDYSDSINVKILAKAENLTIDTLTILKGESAQIGDITVKPENAEEITDITYSSNDTSIATVDENGKVTGIALGSATITVKAKGKISGVEVTGECTVEIKRKTITVTPEQIAENPKEYYGKEVANYTAGGYTYRIFYVDTEVNEDDETKGYFGDKLNSVYLQGDCNTPIFSIFPYTSYDVSNSRFNDMNKMYVDNLLESGSYYGENELYAKIYCLPVTSSTSLELPWSNCYDGSKAKYVIGSTGIEMYVKSYNQAYSGISGAHTLGLGTKYGSAPYMRGYTYIVDGEEKFANAYGYTYTGDGTIDDTLYGGMYFYGSSTMASPVYGQDSPMCAVYNYGKGLTEGDWFNLLFSPLVCLKPDTTIEIYVE